MEIIVGLVSAFVAVTLVRGLTRRAPKQPHFDGDYVSPSYRAKVARQCRNEFDANRLMVR